VIRLSQLPADIEGRDHNPVDVQPQQAGHKEWPVAESVEMNEKALLLIERNEQSPDSTGFRRYQTIFVVRKDGLHKYMEDMGPQELWGNTALSIPGGDPYYPDAEWVMTVQELKESARELRFDLFLREIGHNSRQAPDLISGYFDDIDSRDRERRKASQFGPLYTIQRG